MLRRQIRERREFIYRKSELAKAAAIEKKKNDDRELAGVHLQDKHKITSKEEVDADRKALAEGADSEMIAGTRDDEYRWAGVEDPRILITTSNNPSSKLKEFAKELKLIFPNSQRINRGNCDSKQLVEACRSNGVTDMIVAHERRGVPTQIIVSHLPFGPTAYFTLSNVITHHDLPNRDKMSESFPHLIFHNFQSNRAKRLMHVLKFLFPVPKEESKRVMTFVNDSDYISFRHHIYKKIAGSKEIELTEVGPRFEMRPYKVVAGPLDMMLTSKVEWTIQPYMNNAYKRRYL